MSGGKIFLLFLLAAAGTALLVVIRDFLLPVVLAAVFAVLFYPLQRRFLRLTGGNREISALLTCVAFFAVLLAPAYSVSHIIIRQAADLYQTIASTLSRDGALGQLPLPKGIDWQTVLQENARAAGSYLGKAVNTTSRLTITFLIDLFVLLYGMYYFLKDGAAMACRLRFLLPMNEKYKNELFNRFFSISLATIRGTLLIGLIQGGVGAATLLVFGVQTWLLWGVVMATLSILPIFGPWIVLIPAGIFMIAQGRIGEGITVIAIGVVVLTTIDDLIRPVLVGRNAGISNLMILVSTLGGLAVFGLTGFIVGPLIAALFLTLLDIYGREFQRQLNGRKGPAAAEKSPES